ncbi:hypothetical protein AAFF_G00256460 [Aldrovandia affinis]|uniref:Uncharacterized protein n=1 Tax=Aldrovandia affinis TaxID=143900 RepID=A0AAD7SU57_9TELE|nr:hypothetical protein AAFF_G00256460 [Aldrovandia affinis]
MDPQGSLEEPAGVCKTPGGVRRAEVNPEEEGKGGLRKEPARGVSRGVGDCFREVCEVSGDPPWVNTARLCPEHPDRPTTVFRPEFLFRATLARPL